MDDHERIKDHLPDGQYQRLMEALDQIIVNRSYWIERAADGHDSLSAVDGAEPINLVQVLEYIADHAYPSSESDFQTTEEIIRGLRREQSMREHRMSDRNQGGNPSKVGRVVRSIELSTEKPDLSDTDPFLFVRQKEDGKTVIRHPDSGVTMTRQTFYKARDRIRNELDGEPRVVNSVVGPV